MDSFIVAAVATLPWAEILVAIPLGIALGLPPAVTFLVAVLSNALSVLCVVLVLTRLKPIQKAKQWLIRSRRARGAVAIMNRFGIAGLAAQAPIISGTHAAALIGLLLGVRVWPLTIWLLASIAAWAGIITLLAIQGKRLALG